MKKNGFTLIELLVTMSIVTLLVAIGIPSYSIMKNSVALSSETDEVVNALRTAQNRAVTSQDGVSWGIRFETNSYTLFGGDWAAPTDTTVHQFDAKIQIISATPTTVEFERLTGKSASHVFVIGFPGGKQKTIDVSSSGRISKL